MHALNAPTMTTRLIAVSVITAVALALAACGGSSGGEGTVTTAAEPASTKTSGATATEATEPATTEVAAPDVPVIRVRGGEPVGGVATVTVRNGDTVRFIVTADAPEEVHVHGFDVSKEVGPGQDARFAFKAEFEGVFEVELENSAVKIAEIEVEPS